MFEEREVLTLLISLAVLAFAFWHRGVLKTQPNSFHLIVAYGLLVASFTCSVLEDVAFKHQLNFGQHLTAAASAIVLARWCWKAIVADSRAGQ